MIHINTSGIILSAIAFVSIIFLWFIYDTKFNKNKLSNLDQRLQKGDEENIIKTDQEKDKRDIFEKLQDTLNDAEIQMNMWIFLLIISISTIALYAITLAVFKQPLVAFAPLPFTLYLLPNLIISTKKNKVMDKFDDELIVVLRRMSSVLQSGSVLQALEEVKDMKNLSRKMRVFLNEVHHYNRYGDSIEESFYKASKEIKSENLEIAVVSIDLNKELGADLGSSLNDIAMRIQKKQLSAKEAKSLLAQTIVIGNVLSGAPFLLLGYIAYANPSYFDNYLMSVANQIVFLALIALMFVGIFIIQKGSQTKLR